METGTWKIEQFNRKDRGLRLKSYSHLGQLRRGGAAWAWHIPHAEWISTTTRKRDGMAIIKLDMLEVDIPLLLCIEGDHFVVKFAAIKQFVAEFTAWSIPAALAKQIQKSRRVNCESL